MRHENQRTLKNLTLLALINEVATRSVKDLDGNGISLMREGELLTDAVINSLVGDRITRALTYTNLVSEEKQ